jgi:integrase
MDKITQKLICELDYVKVVSNLLREDTISSTYSNQSIYRIVMLIALTSGMPLKYILDLKWSSIFKIDSRSKVELHEKINISRYYDFPLNHHLKDRLVDFYNACNQPPLQQKILDSLTDKRDLESLHVPLNIALGLSPSKSQNSIEVGNYNNPRLTQILFGRRVFEVCGYTNETSKFLKVYLKLANNKELFEFLGYQSKDDIKYSLSSISLNESEKGKYKHVAPPVFLDDNKHFLIPLQNSKDVYPFQHYQVFYDFLMGLSSFNHVKLNLSMIIVLLISLTNGLRLSSLLTLKWSDLFSIDRTKKVIELRQDIKIGGKNLKISEDLFKKIDFYFSRIMEDNKTIKKGNQISFERMPNLNSWVILTNRGNRLSQSSLNREMKKALKQLGFSHVDKFTTKSTEIMFGRRIIELKGNHKPTIKLLKEHFNFRSTNKLFDFLFINEYKGNKGNWIGGFKSVFDHILYDI